jgi:hypothetical protein
MSRRKEKRINFLACIYFIAEFLLLLKITGLSSTSTVL